MARLVTHTETGPMRLDKDDIEGDTLWICQCGLSADWPRCDGSHAHARGEDPEKVYVHHRETLGGELVTREGFPGTIEEADPRPLDPS